MKFRFSIFVIYLLSGLATLSDAIPSAVADDEPVANSSDEVPNVKLGNEFTKHRKARGRSSGGSAAPAASDDEPSLGRKILLYIPNRFLDLIDVFRADVGVGPSFGAVARVTKYGQVGFRSVPVSLRAGLMGRRAPVMAETSSEFGIGPAYVESKDREVETLEVGAGVDFFIAGAYVGVDFYQIPDFFLGFFGVDYAEDDLT